MYGWLFLIDQLLCIARNLSTFGAHEKLHLRQTVPFKVFRHILRDLHQFAYFVLRNAALWMAVRRVRAYASLRAAGKSII
jgi:hypothetical protein